MGEQTLWKSRVPTSPGPLCAVSLGGVCDVGGQESKEQASKQSHQDGDGSQT